MSHGYGITADIYDKSVRASSFRLSTFDSDIDTHAALLRQQLALDLHALLSQSDCPLPLPQSRFLGETSPQRAQTKSSSHSGYLLSSLLPSLNLGLSFAKASILLRSAIEYMLW